MLNCIGLFRRPFVPAVPGLRRDRPYDVSRRCPLGAARRI